MTFSTQGQLVVFFPVLLIKDLLPSVTLGCLVLRRLTCQKNLILSGIYHYSLSSLPSDFFFLVYSWPIFNLVSPFLKVYKERFFSPYFRFLFYFISYPYFSLTIFSAPFSTQFFSNAFSYLTLKNTSQLSCLIWRWTTSSHLWTSSFLIWTLTVKHLRNLIS